MGVLVGVVPSAGVFPILFVSEAQAVSAVGGF